MATSNTIPGLKTFGVVTGPSVQVSVRRLIALPTKSGWMFAALVALLLIGAINFQNNLGFLMAFGLITLGFLSLLRSGINLSNIQLQIDPPQPIQANSDNARLAVTVRSHQPLEGLLFRPKWPSAKTKTIVRCDRVSHVSLPVPPLLRGIHKLPDIEFGSMYPLGWVILRGRWRPLMELTVYPIPVEPRTEMIHRQRGNQSDLMVREYQRGDRPAQIAWKKSKSVHHLVTVTPDSIDQHAHVSDASYRRVSKEMMLSYLTWEILEHFKNKQPWSFEFQGTLLDSASSTIHRDQCLRMLADA